MKIEILSAQVATPAGDKIVAFKEGADLSEIPADRVSTWTLETTPCDTGSLLKTGGKVDVPQSSNAYPLAYNLAFAQVHLQSVEGPFASGGKPSREFLETLLPMAVLTAYVNRADTSRPLTDAEFASLKNPLEPGTKKK